MLPIFPRDFIDVTDFSDVSERCLDRKIKYSTQFLSEARKRMSSIHDRDVEINRILMGHPVDLKALRKISRLNGGYMTNKIRARVWPKLLQVNRFDIPDYRNCIDPHRDDSQVQVDVERSLWRIDQTKGWNESYREDRRKALCEIIMSILCRNSNLYYYQVC